MSFYIGIDEVGRGSLAGPVVVAALAIPLSFKPKIYSPAGGPKIKLKDSKKLSFKQREKWFQYLNNHPRIFYSIAKVYPKTIDRINITRAANLAANRAFKKLIKLPITKTKVFLDGGLYLQDSLNSDSHSIIKGDEKYNCIKLASIAAKVIRDRLMVNNHKIYPQYNFDKHKGYGTKIHFRALRKYGPSKIHRLTFSPLILYSKF